MYLGYISDLANNKSGIHTRRYLGVGQHPRHVREAVESGRASWREVFHNIKEEHFDKERRNTNKPIPGGSWSRSALSSDASIVRLLGAMRSMSPGGW